MKTPDWPLTLGEASRPLQCRKSMADKMNHKNAWVMGVLEPILLLLLIAVIGGLLELL